MRLDSSIVSVRSGVSPRDRVSLCRLWRRRDWETDDCQTFVGGWLAACFFQRVQISGENTAASFSRPTGASSRDEGRRLSLPTSRLTQGRTGVDVMDRNRRANGGPVATTGNGTYGQFYQRDASGGFTAGGGDLRLGSSGVPGRRVPLASQAASAPSQNTQPFAATNSRVGQPTGESPHQIRPLDP